eukprot:5167002-Pyramimonas_sp.AAC.1
MKWGGLERASASYSHPTVGSAPLELGGVLRLIRRLRLVRLFLCRVDRHLVVRPQHLQRDEQLALRPVAAGGRTHRRLWLYSHDGPIRRRKRGFVLTTDQSDAGSVDLFSRRTNQTQEAR